MNSIFILLWQIYPLIFDTNCAWITWFLITSFNACLVWAIAWVSYWVTSLNPIEAYLLRETFSSLNLSDGPTAINTPKQSLFTCFRRFWEWHVGLFDTFCICMLYVCRYFPLQASKRRHRPLPPIGFSAVGNNSRPYHLLDVAAPRSFCVRPDHHHHNGHPGRQQGSHRSLGQPVHRIKKLKVSRAPTWLGHKTYAGLCPSWVQMED